MLLLSLGSILILVGTIWLIVLAIQTGQSTGEKVIWAIVNFLCQPLGGIVFYIVRKQGLIPLILVIIGVIISGVGWMTSMKEILDQLPK